MYLGIKKLILENPIMKKILFLHGFYASGQCVPAVALQEAFEGRAEVLTPDLPMHPKEAIRFIRDLIDKEKPADKSFTMQKMMSGPSPVRTRLPLCPKSGLPSLSPCLRRKKSVGGLWGVYGGCMGGVWEVLEQHLPCLKPFVRRCFSHIMGGVSSFRPNATVISSKCHRRFVHMT